MQSWSYAMLSQAANIEWNKQLMKTGPRNAVPGMLALRNIVRKTFRKLM